jgi:3-hydroxyisobutyrate dehydrogenase-like beta-hydroxyacid dehydrogenase
MPICHQSRRLWQKELDNLARPTSEVGNFRSNIVPSGIYYADNKQGGQMAKIGILHPGEMGISIAASAMNSGHQVFWISNGRSAKTRARAEKYSLVEIYSLSKIYQTCEIIICICPPDAAEDVARSIVEAGFKGLYLDANAISPQHAIKIGQLLQANGIEFVDGGIIGGPAWTPNETWLYLSGEHAHEIVSCFSDGLPNIKVIGDEIGKASGLKMCYAAYSKGTTALLAATLAIAKSLGVHQELYELWDADDAGFSQRVGRRVSRATAKAWRFEGEMLEIASTFQNEGLPAGFHEAAAEIYHRMADFKDIRENPPLEHVLKSLLAE